MLTGASLAQDRGRMEARIEALTAEVSGLKKECQVNSLTAYVIGHFGVRKFLAFRTRLSAKPFLWQWVYSMRIKIHLHLNDFAPSLASEQRVRTTRKWAKQPHFWAMYVNRKWPFFFFFFGRWFCPNCQLNCLYKSKEAKQYKFYIIRACEEGKGLTYGWRASLKKAFA